MALRSRTMTVWQRDDDFLAGDDDGIQFRILHRCPEQAEIEGLMSECFHLFGRLHFSNVDRSSGCDPLKPPQQARQDGPNCGTTYADRNAARLPPSHLCGVRDRSRSLLKRDAHAVTEHVARRGQAHTAIVSVEKPYTDFLFELPDLLAERRLCNMEQSCCSREVKLLGYCQEIADLANFHMHES